MIFESHSTRVDLSDALDAYRSVFTPEFPQQESASATEDLTELEQLQELFRMAYYDALDQQAYHARQHEHSKYGMQSSLN